MSISKYAGATPQRRESDHEQANSQLRYAASGESYNDCVCQSQVAHCFIAATALPPESSIVKQSPHVLDTYRIAHVLG